MPRPIIEISELTQLVAENLLAGGQKSLVSLACTCRALKEQALSTLWSQQSSFAVLIECTLPQGILSSPGPLPEPTRMEWDEFRRYASWMRQLQLDPSYTISEEVLRMISANSPNGIVCSGLRRLTWVVQLHTLPFYRLFLSPRLTGFTFIWSRAETDILDEILSSTISAILELETSSLRRLYLQFPATLISQGLDSAVSSAVLRCGPSLDSLSVPTPLSDAAIQHIMRLPKLTLWTTWSGPPRMSYPSLSDAFPQLGTLYLSSEASLAWLPLLGATAGRVSSPQDSPAPSHSGPSQQLTSLGLEVEVPLDAAFMSPIMRFHGLVELTLESACSDEDGCAFSLTDGDVSEIAVALPNLIYISFGDVCSSNSCQTTVFSLLAFSLHCKNMKDLEIHFNTKNLCEDLEMASVDPRLNGLPSSPECPVCLLLSEAPYLVIEEDVERVVMGFRRILPSLDKIWGYCTGWEELSSKLLEL